MFEVNSMFAKTVSGLFEFSGGDLTRYGAVLKRHSTSPSGLLHKFFTFSLKRETEEKIIREAVRRAAKHPRYAAMPVAVIQKTIHNAFYGL